MAETVSQNRLQIDKIEILPENFRRLHWILPFRLFFEHFFEHFFRTFFSNFALRKITALPTSLLSKDKCMQKEDASF
jgi:hypothetical protein